MKKTKKIKKVKKIIKKKKVVKKKKAVSAAIRREGKLIGRVTHYFSEIKVAVIKVASPLKNGDKIRIIGGENTDFEQKIVSMQINHKDVRMAKKGSSVGLKINEKVHDGYRVFKLK